MEGDTVIKSSCKLEGKVCFYSYSISVVLYEERSMHAHTKSILHSTGMPVLLILFHSGLDVSLSWCQNHKEAYGKSYNHYYGVYEAKGCIMQGKLVDT